MRDAGISRAAGMARIGWCAALAVLVTVGVAVGPLPLAAQGASSSTGSVVDDLHAEARASQPSKSRNTGGPVSVDALRHPIGERAGKLLRRALDTMSLGKHEEAIGELKATLAKYPDAAPYVHSYLGVEYVKISDFNAAVNSFEQAAAFFPHDAMTHYNLGLSLACAGSYERAEQEMRRTLQLDPKIETAHTLLSVLLDHKQTRD
jgi:tetratricopeptide (TPR) repeat protein